MTEFLYTALLTADSESSIPCPWDTPASLTSVVFALTR